jgi:hypothetical protein
VQLTGLQAPRHVCFVDLSFLSFSVFQALVRKVGLKMLLGLGVTNELLEMLNVRLVLELSILSFRLPQKRLKLRFT